MKNKVCLDFRKIDREFRPLIREMNRAGLKTTQCCCGHGGKKMAYVSISMKGLTDVAIRDKGKRLVFWWWRNRKAKGWVQDWT